MTHWYIRPRATCLPWVANHAYSAGDRCVCTRAYATVARRRYVYECTIAGTSHATTQPAWPASGTIADGGVTWTTRNPTTWANATIFLDYILSLGSAVWTAGDYFWIDSAASITITDTALLLGQNSFNPGDTAVPTHIVSTADVAHEPPTTYDPGATLGSILNVEFVAYGLHLWGITFRAGTGASTGTPGIRGCLGDTNGFATETVFHDCTLALDYAVTGCLIGLGHGSPSFEPANHALRNTTCVFTHAGQYIRLGAGFIDWSGGGISGTPPTTLFFGALKRTPPRALLTGLDLDLCTGTLFSASLFHTAHITLSRCLLNSAVALFTGTPPPVHTMGILTEDCDTFPPPARAFSYSHGATLALETEIVRTNGYTDRANPLSWKIVTTATNNQSAFSTPEIVFDNDIVDMELTARVQILIDSATPLTNADIWIEFTSLDTEDSALATLHTAEGIPLFATANWESSDLQWTTTGMANPCAQALTATFTPAQPGRIAARVRIAKASSTIYVDPMLSLYDADDPAPQPDPIPDFPFMMIEAADGITPMEGLTIAATVSIDGADFVAATNSPTEVASGLYKIALAAPDLAGDWIILRLTADDAVTQHITLQP